MVNVALSLEMGVDLRAGVASRAVFECTVARKRACVRFFVTCPRTPEERTAGLRICESMLCGGLKNGSRRYNGGLGRLSVY